MKKRKQNSFEINLLYYQKDVRQNPLWGSIAKKEGNRVNAFLFKKLIVHSLYAYSYDKT
jgi:hypothetical protein